MNHSFSGYLEPTVYNGNTSPISTQLYTKFNATHYSYTFRCQNCVSWEGGGFDPAGEFAVMGWALSVLPVAQIGNPASTLQTHEGTGGGFGQYGVSLPDARKAQYASWLAAVPTPTGTTTTTTSTSTSTSSTSSATPIPTTVLGTYDYVVVGGGAAGLVGS